MDKTIKVLAVDDENYMLKILKACMPSPAFDLTACSDAMTAMSVFKKGAFDILLLDVVMPGIDGFELHSLIRNVNAAVPIVMLTAKIDDVNGTMLKRISSDKNTYYQSKSFTKEELVAKIIDIVNKMKLEREKKSYFEEMEKDIALAGEVQRSMFPNWDTTLDTMRSRFYYRPYMKITGDIYSIMRLSYNMFLCILGDISGHGIQAALCMSAIQYSLARFIRNFPEEAAKPHKVLNHLQDFMTGIVPDRYMTCLVSIIDFNNNTVCYQNAGHPDFVMYSRSMGFIPTNPESKGALPVGLFPTSNYKESENVLIGFPEDAVLFAYTDGLTDIQNVVGRTYNSDPLREFVETFSKDTVTSSSVFRIMDALFKLGFNDVRDDISIAAISRNVQRENCYEFSIKPMISDVDHFAQKISRLTLDKTKDEMLAAKIEILLSEFLNNVVVHGLGNKNSQRPIIAARIEFGKKNILLTFCDKGKKWDMNAYNFDDGASDILNYTRATSGRGLSLIKKITSSVRRSRYADTLNETIFTVEYGNS